MRARKRKRTHVHTCLRSQEVVAGTCDAVLGVNAALLQLGDAPVWELADTFQKIGMSWKRVFISMILFKYLNSHIIYRFGAYDGRTDEL